MANKHPDFQAWLVRSLAAVAYCTSPPNITSYSGMLRRLARPRINTWGIRAVSSVPLKPLVEGAWVPAPARIAQLQKCADLVAAEKFRASRKILAQAGIEPLAPDNTAVVCALIESALSERLYQLAAVFYIRFYKLYSIPNRYLKTLVDGLTRYDPKLTPLHIKTLSELHHELGSSIKMDAFQKLRFLESSLAVQKSDARQVFTAYALAEKIDGAKIPDVVMQPLIKFFASKEDFGKIAQIWNYLCTNYQDTYLSHTDIVFPLLVLFLRRKRFRRLSLEIAHACLSRVADNPQYALGVAETARVAHDLALAEKLRTELKDNLPRPVVGQLMCLYANAGDYKQMADMVSRMENGKFTSVELGSLVKHYLQVDVDQAFEIIDKFSGATKYKVAAYTAVCDHAIGNKDLDQFKRYLDYIQRDAGFDAHGLCTNLQLKWDSQHEGFARAKRSYLNRSLTGRIDSKQRKIALNILMDLIIEQHLSEGALVWLESEYRRLHIPVGQFHKRLNARMASKEKKKI